MRELVEHLRASERKGWFRARPIWQPYKVASEDDLQLAVEKAGTALPDDLVLFLRALGFGDIADDDLSFRLEWFHPVESGSLKGAALFAQDGLGNFYAFVPPENRIVFFARREHVYADIADSFEAFLRELQQRDYQLFDWIRDLKVTAYEWDAA